MGYYLCCSPFRKGSIVVQRDLFEKQVRIGWNFYRVKSRLAVGFENVSIMSGNSFKRKAEDPMAEFEKNIEKNKVSARVREIIK